MGICIALLNWMSTTSSRIVLQYLWDPVKRLSLNQKVCKQVEDLGLQNMYMLVFTCDSEYLVYRHFLPPQIPMFLNAGINVNKGWYSYNVNVNNTCIEFVGGSIMSIIMHHCTHIDHKKRSLVLYMVFEKSLYRCKELHDSYIFKPHAYMLDRYKPTLGMTLTLTCGFLALHRIFSKNANMR